MAALGLTTGSPPARAVDIEAVGPWLIKSGEGKEGPYCTAELKVDEREIALQVIKKDRRYVFGLANPAWRWEQKRSYAAIVEVTDGWPGRRLGGWTGDAVAILPTALVLLKSEGADPMQLFSRGKTLNVMVGETYMRFDLSAFTQAAAVLERCIRAPDGQRT